MAELQRWELACAPHEREQRGAECWMAGAVGVMETPDGIVAWFNDQPHQLTSIGTWSVEPDRDWQEGWKATIAPVMAGPVAIVPTWLADDFEVPPQVETVVVLDPGQAFGSGHHATTEMCCRALASLDLENRSVLDVGTGSGVLAAVAAMRGARPVVGVDLDPFAVPVARANLERNGVVAEITAGTASQVEGTFDVVAANLVTDVIAVEASALRARTAAVGVLVASGISVEREAVATAALAAAGFVERSREVTDGWVCVVTSPDPP